MAKSQPSSTFDIFISYRREDSRADAGRLYDRLNAHFGAEHVFMDIDDIDPGQNFATVLEQTLDRCRIVIVVIGTDWLDCRNDQGQQRLHTPDDFVCSEIQLALQRGITVVPVLVGGADMPTDANLPQSIKGLALQQACVLNDQRFHADVDDLIEDLQATSGALARKRRKLRPVVMALCAVAVVAVLVALYYFATTYQANRELQQQVAIGDRFAEQGNFVSAIDEYDKALEQQPDNTQVLRKLVKVKRQRLLETAFGSTRSSVNIGLRSDYARFQPVPKVEIDDALQSTYRLQELQPQLKDDVDILIDEALIFKASGPRSDKAIAVLQRAVQLAPDNARAQAEFGLLSTMLLGKTDTVAAARKATELAPEDARYHLYLAIVLDQIHQCSSAAGDRSATDAANSCSEAIFEYRQANELASADDLWSRQIRSLSISKAMNIFHRVARSEKQLLADDLAMSVEQRIEAIEYLIARERSRSRHGPGDFPLFWLAQLYESKGEPGKALASIRKLIDEKSNPARLWLEIYARLLEQDGNNLDDLAKVKALLRDKNQ